MVHFFEPICKILQMYIAIIYLYNWYLYLSPSNMIQMYYIGIKHWTSHGCWVDGTSSWQQVLPAPHRNGVASTAGGCPKHLQGVQRPGIRRDYLRLKFKWTVFLEGTNFKPSVQGCFLRGNVFFGLTGILEGAFLLGMRLFLMGNLMSLIRKKMAFQVGFLFGGFPRINGPTGFCF